MTKYEVWECPVSRMKDDINECVKTGWEIVCITPNGFSGKVKINVNYGVSVDGDFNNASLSVYSVWITARKNT
jgi:hypothetical protein